MTQMRLQITIFSEINNYGLGSFKNDRDDIEPGRPEHLPRSHFLDLLYFHISTKFWTFLLIYGDLFS